MAFYPLLCIYKGFYRFTIGDIILMMFVGVSLFLPPKRDSRIAPIVLFLFYTVVVFAINTVILQSINSAVFMTYAFRLLKLIFYFVSACVCGKKLFDPEIFQKTVVYVGIAATLFILFQYYAYYVLGEVYLGRIPFWEIYIQDYNDLDYEYIYSFTFRPCSFFLEPATLSQYMVIPLIYVLFSNDFKLAKKIVLCILFSIAIALSTSGQGTLYLALSFIAYTITGVKKKKYILHVLMIIIITAVVLYFCLEPFRFAIDRLLFGSGALNSRVSTYKYIWEMKGLHFIFGYGYGVLPNKQYFAGAPYVWYGCGLIGVLLVVFMFAWLFAKTKSKKSRLICICFFIMFWATSLFYSNMLFWYITLILCSVDTNKGKKIRNHHSYVH